MISSTDGPVEFEVSIGGWSGSKTSIHTTPEEFESGGSTLQTHEMFCVHTAPGEFNGATITGYFLFEENSVRENT